MTCTDVTDPTAWQLQGACRTCDPGVNFFPGPGQDAWPAKRVCAACPVAQPCLDYALTAPLVHGIPVQGIWAATSEKLRRRMRKGVVTAVPPIVPLVAVVKRSPLRAVRRRAVAKVYRSTHAEVERARRRRYRESHPDRERAWDAVYRAKHADERRAYSLAYNEANRDRRRAYNRAYNRRVRAEARAAQEVTA